MSRLRAELAAEIHHARDIMLRDQVRRVDYRTADCVITALTRLGIGHWVTRTNPADRQRVLIDLGRNRVEVATYDEYADEFIPAVEPERRCAIPADSILGWMALP